MTDELADGGCPDGFQSTYRSRGMTEAEANRERVLKISIHIPLARYDGIWFIVAGVRGISIHIPLARYDRR